MTTKKKTPLTKNDKISESESYAKISLSASYMGAILADSFTSTILPKAEMAEVVGALSDKITTIQDGDMKPIEAMLISQAQALQTMFVTLGRMAASKTSLPQYTAFMNMALKAQSQSRATIQALVELKYPKQATFVKQANIANGHQQVNNGSLDTNTRAHAHVKENQNQPNKLLEAQANEWLDNGKTTTPSTTNQAMATVET
ncbi:hypothetical protein [Methylotenera versatilis]|uniref:Uncharacterized protein n=1 Tax=Methylotenera versatilis (strain 301) TaxID=666681 RepID=D7DHK1_METV0|nr:hypothetical protein [Methylotenera versatilis]ADI29536.1 conserved hypothetical protein [Methylotenera versatilis 301]